MRRFAIHIGIDVDRVCCYGNDDAPVDLKKLSARQHPKHCAIAMQSTHSISIEDRKSLYKWAEERVDDELDA